MFRSMLSSTVCTWEPTSALDLPTRVGFSATYNKTNCARTFAARCHGYGDQPISSINISHSMILVWCIDMSVDTDTSSVSPKRRAFEAERLRIKRALLEAKKNGEAVGNIARGAAQGNGKGKSNESARKSSLADVMPLPHSAAPQLGGKLRNGLAVDGMEQAGKREKHTSKQAHRSAKDDAKQEKNSVGAGSTNMDVPARSDGTGTEEGSAVEVTDNRPGDVSAVTTGTSGTRTKQSTGEPRAEFEG